MSKAGGQGTSPSRWLTVVNSVRPCEHETSASLFEQSAVQTMADVTAPPVAPCACHYIILQASLSLLSSLIYQSITLVSIRLLQPGRPFLGSLGYQSLVLLALICCSLAALSSAVSDASRSVNLCSLASLSSAVSDASLSVLVARICCNVLSLLSELCAARLALSRSHRCLNLRSLCSAVSAARRVLSRSLLRRSLSSLFCEDPVVSMLVANRR